MADDVTYDTKTGNTAEDYFEPWTVREVKKYHEGLGRDRTAHRIHDCFGRQIQANGESLKALNERIAACVNFCRGVSTLHLEWNTGFDFVKLFKGVLEQPEDLTPLLMLKDEIDEIIQKRSQGETYTSRASLINLLDSIARCENDYGKNPASWYLTILNMIGVKCQAGVFYGETRYPCDRGSYYVPKDVVTPDKVYGIWTRRGNHHVQRCPFCHGQGLVLPSMLDDGIRLKGGELETEEKT